MHARGAGPRLWGRVVGQVGWVGPGVQHYAVMTGLLPGQRYYYRVGNTSPAASTAQPTTGSSAGPAAAARTRQQQQQPGRQQEVEEAGQPAGGGRALQRQRQRRRLQSGAAAAGWVPLGGGWTEEFSFVAPPEVGPGSTVRLLAVADLGQAEVSRHQALGGRQRTSGGG